MSDANAVEEIPTKKAEATLLQLCSTTNLRADTGKKRLVV
jgi:hypothetical protein